MLLESTKPNKESFSVGDLIILDEQSGRGHIGVLMKKQKVFPSDEKAKPYWAWKIFWAKKEKDKLDRVSQKTVSEAFKSWKSTLELNLSEKAMLKGVEHGRIRHFSRQK
jgi:hypothetical protein